MAQDSRFAWAGEELVDAFERIKWENLNLARKIDYTDDDGRPVHLVKYNSKRYTIPGCFSHNPESQCERQHSNTGNGGGESQKHLHAKYLLKKMVGGYKFMVSKCKFCDEHDSWECGDGISDVKVEKYHQHNDYDRSFYDVAYMREGKLSVALEVWHKCRTGKRKIDFTREDGIVFAEFDADDVIEMENWSGHDELHNLAVRKFTCDVCREKRQKEEAERIEQRRLHEERQKEERQKEEAERIEQRRLHEERQKEEPERIEQRRLYLERQNSERCPGGFENPNPGAYDLKVYGRTLKVHTPEQMRERDLLQSVATDDDYRRHTEEYNARVRWCINQGPQYWPAHENKHRAPGDDANFIFKIPPWHADGSVNPLGVPDNRFVEPVLPGFELPIEYDSKTGWNCHKCHEWVSLPPRKFEGGVEPDDWWWCLTCRKNKPKLTARQKKFQAEVARIRDIRGLINTECD